MQNVIIFGAGPAGLAAGYELVKHAVKPVIIELDEQVGGISKTVTHNGNYFDLGGHRFFTKSDEVNTLWKEILGNKFLKRPRQSRIYYNNKFFNYPLTAMNALLGVGIIDTIRILLSYGKAKMFPSPTENTFEEWVSNRFGRRLFAIFFKTYTEKVWGIPCSEIQAEWAAQRIKGLSLYHAVMNAVFKAKSNKITTLIDEFDYPEYGPGMMYNAMQSQIEQRGGAVLLREKVVEVRHDGQRVTAVRIENKQKESRIQEGENFLSSIPITELVQILSPSAPPEVLNAAKSLTYRSLVTVDITVNQKELFTDNWIYVHSPEVKLGRIQNFKNWSPSMAADKNKSTLGLEYFCNEGDEFWNLDDNVMFELAADEVAKIKICKREKIEDYLVVRVPKAYPVYDMEYSRHIALIREYLSGLTNLQPIGRYGMFKYNNMDHSILTGLYAARNILADKPLYDVWNVNTDEEYHEEKQQSDEDNIVENLSMIMQHSPEQKENRE
jgi:protoporphyrinogen oxidase